MIETTIAELRTLAARSTGEVIAARTREIGEQIASGATSTTAEQRRELLTIVRGRRDFEALASLCNAMILAGHDEPRSPTPPYDANPDYDPRVRQELIQSMIDRGLLVEALDVADQHRRRIESLGEGNGRPPADATLNRAWGQALGLTGRIHKQIYVENCEQERARRFDDHLRHAITWYGTPFREPFDTHMRIDETRDDEWHAINFIALLARAEKDGVSFPGEDAKTRAGELISLIEAKLARSAANGKDPGAWTYASLGEANIVLGNWQQAAEAYGRYAGHANVDRFQIYGSLRQLIEVWGIDGTEGEGRAQSVLDALGKGFAALAGPDEDPDDGLFHVEEHYDDSNRLVTRLTLKGPGNRRGEVLQSTNPQVFQGISQAFRTAFVMPMVRAVRTANSVGRVINADSEETVGTGFLIDGAHVAAELQGTPVFITNWHVLSEAGFRSAVHKRNARIRFDLASEEAHRTLDFKVATFLWESPEAHYDACLVLLSPTPQWLAPLPVALEDDCPDSLDDIPARDRCCCVVGFAGRDRSRFVGDGHSLRLLDIGRRREPVPHAPLYLHYSNHTQPGDSGGPVCNASWQVMGLHHAGATPQRKLAAVTPGRHDGTVAEGIAMKSILTAVAHDVEMIAERLGRRSIGLQNAERMSPGEAFDRLVAIGDGGDLPDEAALEQLVTTATTFIEDDQQIDMDDLEEVPAMGPIVGHGDTAQRSTRAEMMSGVAVLLSKIYRVARNARFSQSTSGGTSGIRLLTDGDSWFQYPKPGVVDTIDHLLDRHGYLVSCGAIAGETLEGRLAETDIDVRARELAPDAIVLSGGGNDMLGYGAISAYLRPYRPGMALADILNEAAIATKIDLLVMHHQTWISRIRDFDDTVPIFNHGYDHAIPKRKGPWLDRPMSRMGIKDAALQREIVRTIIDRFCEAMGAMSKKMPNVHFVDCRGAVGPGGHWMDELHPTNDGFARVADRFHAEITRVLAGRA